MLKRQNLGRTTPKNNAELRETQKASLKLEENTVEGGIHKHYFDVAFYYPFSFASLYFQLPD